MIFSFLILGLTVGCKIEVIYLFLVTKVLKLVTIVPKTNGKPTVSQRYANGGK